MNRKLHRLALIISVLLLLIMTAGCDGNGSAGSPGTDAEDPRDISLVAEETAGYLAENAEAEFSDYIGGGWVAFALARSEYAASHKGWLKTYADSVHGIFSGRSDVLAECQPTDYERVAITFTSLGDDPADIEGADLIEKFDDYEVVSAQGLNAEIFALIASNYAGKILASEDHYLKDLLDSQNDDGGFGYDESGSDADMTAMALQALSSYDARAAGNEEHARAEAEDAIDSALAWLKDQQQTDGSFGSCESTSQVIIALGCLGKDPAEEESFTKDGQTLIDGLLVYYTAPGFCHELMDGQEPVTDGMATEQAMMALDAIQLAKDGKRLYRR